MTAPFLAIDWGTTNRRVYRIDANGAVEHTARDDRGILAVAADAFPGEIAGIRKRFGDLPVLCAGMAGSNRGWVEVPYVRGAADIDSLAQNLHWVEAGRTAIVPGVAHSEGSRRDVMRGEEVQLLGAVEGGLTPRSALLCQPGTHCKWAWMDDGRIGRFVTAMTGELFHLIRSHSLLAPQLAGEAADGPAFRAGLADAAGCDLAARLFGVRADSVTGTNAIAEPVSYVSGLLIGSDVRNRIARGQKVFVLGDAALGGLYKAAIEDAGGTATLVDSHDAFVSGIDAIWRGLR